MGQMTDRAAVSRWLAEYEAAWRTPGTLTTEILAVDGPTVVVRAEVRYGDPVQQEFRDLWIMRLGDDGRCGSFEEWPFWPGRPYAPAG
jgi:hypothetical protein